MVHGGYNADEQGCPESLKDFDEIEFRAGRLIVGCKCVRNDGMQHECRRTECQGRPECVAYPKPTCAPGYRRTCSRADDDEQSRRRRNRRRQQIKQRPNEDDGGSSDESMVRMTSAATAERIAARRRELGRRLLKRARAQYSGRRVCDYDYKFVPCRAHAVPSKCGP